MLLNILCIVDHDLLKSQRSHAQHSSQQHSDSGACWEPGSFCMCHGEQTWTTVGPVEDHKYKLVILMLKIAAWQHLPTLAIAANYVHFYRSSAVCAIHRDWFWRTSLLMHCSFHLKLSLKHCVTAAVPLTASKSRYKITCLDAQVINCLPCIQCPWSYDHMVPSKFFYYHYYYYWTLFVHKLETLTVPAWQLIRLLPLHSYDLVQCTWKYILWQLIWLLVILRVFQLVK